MTWFRDILLTFVMTFAVSAAAAAPTDSGELQAWYSLPGDASWLYDQAFSHHQHLTETVYDQITPPVINPLDSARPELDKNRDARHAKSRRILSRATREVIDKGWAYRDAAVELLVKEETEILALALRAGQLDTCSFVRGRKVSSELRLPHLKQALGLSQYLVVKGVSHEYNKECDKATDYFVANRILSHHIAQDSVMAAKLMSLVIEMNGNRAMSRTTSFPPEAAAVLLLRLIAVDSNRVPVHRIMPNELAYIHNEAPRMFDDEFFERQFAGIIKLEDAEVLERSGLLSDRWASKWYRHAATLVYNEITTATRAPSMMWTLARAGETMQRYGLDRDQGVEDLAALVHEIIAASGVVLEELSVETEVTDAYVHGLATAYSVMLAPVMQGVETTLRKECRGKFESDATVTRLALEIFKAKTGSYADSLQALVPALLPTVPVDPFDGKTVRYERMGPGYRFYSVGPDLVDSNGNDEQNLEMDDNLGDIVYRSP
jgi:hypothetical protein